jgi:hypothetical protein
MAISQDSQYGVVDHIPKQFRESQQFVGLITPSGSRKKRDYWKSCFYWIAYTAQVPIAGGFFVNSLFA